MAASAGAWYRVGKVNVTNDNQSVVGVDTNWQNDVIAIAIGDIFTLDAKIWYEVTAVNSDTSITLDRGFEGSTGTNKTYAIVRNTSGTILTRIAGQVSVQFNQKQLFLDELRTWLNSDNATEELTDSHGLKQSLKTPSQMVRDHDEKLAELDAIHPYPYAMRKVEFEARRAANNEKFAASGFVHFGRHRNSTGLVSINEGLYTSEKQEDTLLLGRARSTATAEGHSRLYKPLVNVTGYLTLVDSLSNDGAYGAVVKFPLAEGGTRTYDSTTGLSVTHASPAIAFASETTTNKVVTDRTDMWGYEAFLREINDADPFVYANGLIQSLATSINGVATVSDNVRPITYFAWYEGDEGSRGKGVNWQTATETQRIAIASAPNNNIYFDDATGKFYQWCLRGCSFAGADNGEFKAIESSVSSSGTGNFLGYNALSRVLMQGNQDQRATDNATHFFSHQGDSTYNEKPNIGVFTGRSATASSFSANGEVYFLVCGTVNRLNQGAYHPSFNPLGSSTLVNTNGSRVRWYLVDPSRKITSSSDCFNYFNDGGFVSGGAIGGAIEGGFSGRPDDRYFDAIYANGQGGVCRDMRYSAWGLTPEDFAEADLKIKSGDYRGRELLVTSKVLDTGYWDTSDHSNKRFKWINYQGSIVVYLNPTLYGIASGDSIIIIDKTAGFVLRLKNVAAVGVSVLSAPLDSCTSLIGAIPSTNTNGETSTEIYLIHEKLGTYSLSSEYLHTEVIGDPANILQCDALKEGWVGSWNPNIPTGTDAVKLTKKALNTTGDMAVYTSDFGSSWGSSESAQNLDLTNNTIKHPTLLGESNVVVYTYAAQAKYTQSRANSPIHGASVGVGQVFTSMDAAVNKGVLLCSFLTGEVSTHQTTALSIGEETLYLTSHSILSAAKTLWGANVSVGETKHTHLNLSAPTNQSHAFKALNYNVVENHQGFINYAYTELKYDGGWGDDGKIHIVSNESTMLDDNGQTVKVGTARIVEPLGWVKNDK